MRHITKTNNTSYEIILTVPISGCKSQIKNLIIPKKNSMSSG